MVGRSCLLAAVLSIGDLAWGELLPYCCLHLNGVGVAPVVGSEQARWASCKQGLFMVVGCADKRTKQSLVVCFSQEVVCEYLVVQGGVHRSSQGRAGVDSPRLAAIAFVVEVLPRVGRPCSWRGVASG